MIQNNKKTPYLESRRTILSILVMILLGVILSISLTSAFIGFDNIKTYDDKTQTINLKGTFLFVPTGDIANITLDTPKENFVMRGDSVLVAEFTINSYTSTSDVLDNINFYNANKGDKIGRSFVYKKKVITKTELPEYKEECGKIEILKNGSSSQDCKIIQVGTYTQNLISWIPFDEKGAINKDDKITLGIFTKVLPNEKVEWIPTFYGTQINEWASWNESFNSGLVAYWKFDETSGKNVTDSVAGIYNGTEVDTLGGGFEWRLGKIGNSYYSNETGYIQINNQSIMIPSGGAYSISVWENLTSDFTYRSPFFEFKSSDYTRIFMRDEDYIRCGRQQSTRGVSWSGMNTYMTYGQWYNVVCVFDGVNEANANSYSLYINGTLYTTGKTSTNFGGDNNQNQIGISNGDGASADALFGKGNLDELGLWNRSLSAGEASALYNNGNGITYGSGTTGGSLTTTLLSPPNNTDISISSYQFNASCSPTNTTLTNATFYLWKGGILQISSTNTLSGITNMTSSFTGTGLSGNYTWNVKCEGLNLTSDAISSFAISNYSLQSNFSVIGINSQTYNLNTIEGASETFGINFTLVNLTTQATLVYFYYNNTQYNSTSFINYGLGNYVVTKDLIIPQVNADVTNSFYWVLNFDDGTNYTTSPLNQNVKNLGFDNCSSYSVNLLNYTFYDEDSRTLIPTTENLSLAVTLTLKSYSGDTTLLTYSTNFSNTNPVKLCMNVNLSSTKYSLYAVAKYSTTNREIEYNVLQNFTLQNSSIPKQIDLYDLLSSSSQPFSVVVKDRDYALLSGAVVNVLRQYVDTGQSLLVEAPQTDDFGNTALHLVRDSVTYTIFVTKNGELIATFNNIIAICQNPLVTDCSLTLTAPSQGADIPNWQNLDNLQYKISFNNNTRVVSSSFSTTDGSSPLMTLNVSKDDMLGSADVCSSQLTSSTGILSCLVPLSFGNESIRVELIKNNNLVAYTSYSTKPSASDIFGATGIFFTILLFMTLPFMFLGDRIFVVVFGLVGLALASLLNFFSGGSVFGLASTILWLIIAGGILIWKLSGRT